MRPRFLLALLAVTACHKAHSAGPAVVISADAPGRLAADVEAVMATPLERACATIPHLALLRSASEDGRAAVVLELEGGVDPDVAFHAAVACVGQARAALPVDAPTPSVTWAPGAAVARYAWSSNVLPMTEVATARAALLDAIAQIAGVGAIERCGEARTQVVVEVKTEGLAAYGMTVNDVVAGVSADGAAAGASSYAARVLGVRNGAPIRLSDVAVVQDDAAPSMCRVLDEHRAVTVDTVRLRPGADEAKVVAAVTAKMRELTPTLPPSIVVREMHGQRVLDVDLTPDADPRVVTSLRDAVLAAAGSGVLVEMGRTADPRWPSAGARVVLESTKDEVAARVLGALRQLPFVRSAGEPNTVVTLVGADRTQLDAAAREAAAIMEARGELVARAGLMEHLALRPRIDEAAAQRLGVAKKDVEVALAARMGTTAAWAGDRPIVVRAAGPLDHLYVKGSQGPIPLSSLVAMRTEPAASPALHSGQFPAVVLRARTRDTGALRKALATHPGVEVRVEALEPAR